MLGSLVSTPSSRYDLSFSYHSLENFQTWERYEQSLNPNLWKLDSLLSSGWKEQFKAARRSWPNTANNILHLSWWCCLHHQTESCFSLVFSSLHLRYTSEYLFRHIHPDFIDTNGSAQYPSIKLLRHYEYKSLKLFCKHQQAEKGGVKWFLVLELFFQFYISKEAIEQCSYLFGGPWKHKLRSQCLSA